MRVIAATEFRPVSAPQSLADDEIHLWFFPTSKADAGKVDHAHQLRVLLGAYLHIDAADLRIERNEHGKPFLGAAHTAALQFNLAHSADALIVALARAQVLGVDIENMRRARPWMELARRYFTAREYAALDALAPERLGVAFVRLWSCKEAVLKALGRGIAFGLERLDFELDAAGDVIGLQAIAAEAGDAAEWRLLRLAPLPDLCGALAWRGPAMRVCSFRHETGNSR